jgi:GNAT superfamily N-acetyltransferase
VLLSAQLGEHSLAPARPALEAAVAEVISDARLGRIFVAEVAGLIVGVAAMSWTYALEHGGRAVWLDELYVVPERRGQGIGAALLQAARATAAAGGALAMELEVEAGHERVSSLYERHGFTRHQRQRWFARL